MILFFIPSWRMKHFPKFNASLMKISKLILKMKWNKMLIVDPKAIIDNKFIIPHFSNVELEYETSGQFSDYLSRISIRQCYKNSPYDFLCVFKFRHKPKEGYLKLRYV